MVNIIIGKKGSGKTKRMVDLAHAAAEKSNGNVVCIEKGDTLTYQLNHRVRLIDAEHYGVSGFDMYYGMICGICAGNYDVTDLFGDATLRIGSREPAELEAFLNKAAALSEEAKVNMIFTVSADENELTEAVLAYKL